MKGNKITQLKKKLISEILKILKIRKLNQSETAKLLKITQPRVSMIYNYKMKGFSIDYLLDIICKLDPNFELIVKNPR